MPSYETKLSNFGNDLTLDVCEAFNPFIINAMVSLLACDFTKKSTILKKSLVNCAPFALKSINESFKTAVPFVISFIKSDFALSLLLGFL